MIVPDQKNLKVHYATVEDITALIGAKAGGADYLLFTAFPLIARKFGLRAVEILMGKTSEQMPDYIQTRCRHAIMDSGLFTLMFGSHAGKKDQHFIESWQQGLIDFVGVTGYKGTMVEVDCQKVLSPEAAWVLREKLRRELPHNRQINVYHNEDGYKGLDRLIEFSNYIAVSVPEMRILGRSKYNILKLVSYIKNRKPEIDIHLLGCTDLTLLKMLSFCSSSDSSSWISSVRYGQLQTMSGKVHISNLHGSDVIDEYLLKVHELVEEIGLTTGYDQFYRMATFAFAAAQLKHIYGQACGSQK